MNLKTETERVQVGQRQSDATEPLAVEPSQAYLYCGLTGTQLTLAHLCLTPAHLLLPSCRVSQRVSQLVPHTLGFWCSHHENQI